MYIVYLDEKKNLWPCARWCPAVEVPVLILMNTSELCGADGMYLFSYVSLGKECGASQMLISSSFIVSHQLRPPAIGLIVGAMHEKTFSRHEVRAMQSWLAILSA